MYMKCEMSVFNRSKDIDGSQKLHIGMMTLCQWTQN